MTTRAYIRVSTAEQVHTHLSLDAQRSAITRYATAAFDDQALRFYEEHASAATLHLRPVLAGLLAALAQGDALVVLRFDRLARSALDLLSIVQRIRDSHATLHSVTERLDTESAAGKMFLTVLGAMAEFERDLIADRTRAALAHARANGTLLGRLAWCFDDRALHISPSTLSLIAEISAARLAGHSIRYIAHRYGLTAWRVRYVLNCPALANLSYENSKPDPLADQTRPH